MTEVSGFMPCPVVASDCSQSSVQLAYLIFCLQLNLQMPWTHKQACAFLRFQDCSNSYFWGVSVGCKSDTHWRVMFVYMLVIKSFLYVLVLCSSCIREALPAAMLYRRNAWNLRVLVRNLYRAGVPRAFWLQYDHDASLCLCPRGLD